MVDVLGIDHDSRPNSSGEGVLLARHDQQMDMVIHQTASPWLQMVFTAISDKGIAIEAAVFVVEKDRDAIVPPLGYIMRIIHSNCTAILGMREMVVSCS